MPELLHLPPVAQAIAVMLGVALAIFRLLTASKAFWDVLPNKLQKAIPALLVALGLLPAALEHAKSWLDVATAITLVVGAYFTASRGDQSPPKDSNGGPRLQRSNTDPKVDDRSRLHNDLPDEPAEFRAWAPRLCAGSLIAFSLIALAMPLLGCSSWKPVARTGNDVARVLCGEFFGEKQGISFEDAAKKFCETRDDLAPWIDAVLAAKREAAPKAAALHP